MRWLWIGRVIFTLPALGDRATTLKRLTGYPFDSASPNLLCACRRALRIRVFYRGRHSRNGARHAPNAAFGRNPPRTGFASRCGGFQPFSDGLRAAVAQPTTTSDGGRLSQMDTQY